MLSMADKPMNCWATKNIHHDDPSFNFHHWLTSQLQATKSFSFTGYGPEFCSCCKTTYMLCHHISKHLNICWSIWLYLVFQAVSLVFGMWMNTLLHVTNKNVPWCVWSLLNILTSCWYSQLDFKLPGKDCGSWGILLLEGMVIHWG